MKSKISLERICDRICTKLCPFRLSESKNAVYRYVIRRKSKTEIYNPIQVYSDSNSLKWPHSILTTTTTTTKLLQYFFEHNKAPPFNHKLIEIDFNDQRAPMDFPLDKLPNFWAQHVKDVSCFTFLNGFSFIILVWLASFESVVLAFHKLIYTSIWCKKFNRSIPSSNKRT